MTGPQYDVACWHCLAEFDGMAAVWCSCSPSTPNKICPFCLRCLCGGGRDVVEHFWSGAPADLAHERGELAGRRLPLGDMLVASGRTTRQQIDEAVEQQGHTGQRLGDCLVQLGHLENTDLDRLLGEQHAPVAFDLGSRAVEPELCHAVGIAFCLENRLVPMERARLNGADMVMLAMADPSNVEAVSQVQDRLGARVVLGKVPEAEIVDLLARLFPDTVSRPDAVADCPDAVAQALLHDALASRASHLQLRERNDGVQIYWAVDGILHLLPDRDDVHGAHVDALLARFADVAHGGGLRVEAGERRALAYTHASGSSGSRTVTVRFFEFDDMQTSIETLTLDTESRFAVNQALSAATGLVILTGPAGSACETTLWSFLNEMALAGRQVALFNAPLAHPAENIHEGPLAMGSALEDAPDPLPELNWDIDALALYRCNAQAAVVRAVLESRRRLVLIRIPAADATEALQQLIAAGVASDRLSALLTLVVEQRAVRRICSRCFDADPDGNVSLAELGYGNGKNRPFEVYRGRGCETCGLGAGYRGRVPLIQVLSAGPEVGRAVRDAELHRLRNLPRAHGQATPEGLCLDLMRRGITTPEEVRRVLDGRSMPLRA